MAKDKSIMPEHSSSGKCGYVAIVGRPNVGKSTLLNHILGQKLSITSRKPQTTRHTLLGIKTEGDLQAIYVDTPGLHKTEHNALNRYMNRSAAAVINDVDVIVFVVDRLIWEEEDELVYQRLKKAHTPVVLVVNKVDKIDDKNSLLPHLQFLAEKTHAGDANSVVKEIVPLSALRGQNIDHLETVIANYLPSSQHFFPEDQITDRTERFLAAEIIREKIIRQLGNELPYQITVEIEQFKHEKGIIHIHALIWVERDSQKAIVIGRKGARLKQIGQEARLDMEKLFDNKLMLNLWVKVKQGWSDDDRALKSLGYDDL